MLIYVNLNQIDDNPFQRRSEYGDIPDLAARIAAARDSYPESYGLMQISRGRLLFQNSTCPEGKVVELQSTFLRTNTDHSSTITIRTLESDSALRVQLAFGHRRLRAFRHLHESDADGYADSLFPIHIDPLTDDQMLDAVWSENRERKDISAVEEAELLKMKMERLGNQTAVAADWGLARSTIANRLRLLELPEEIQQANRVGDLSERQALAIAPALRIEGLTNGRVKWGDRLQKGWGDPSDAQTLIAAVIKNPSKFTSDEIRDHTRAMLNHAGEKMAQWIDKEQFEEGKSIEQSQCKGCAYRINQVCLQSKCLRAKMKQWPDMALVSFTKSSGIPISDEAEDFEPFKNYSEREKLVTLYEAGEIDNIVCGWLVGCSAARPHKNGPDYVHRIEHEKDGLHGIGIGYRGTLPVAESEESGKPTYEMPPQQVLEAWQKSAPQIAARIKKQLIEALTEALSYQVSEFNIFQALIQPIDAKWIDEDSKMTKKLIDFLISMGRGMPAFNSGFYADVQVYKAVAKRAGMDDGVTKVRLEETPVLILSHWYDNHDNYWFKDYAHHDWYSRIAADNPFATMVEMRRMAHDILQQNYAMLQRVQQRRQDDGVFVSNADLIGILLRKEIYKNLDITTVNETSNCSSAG